MPNRPIASPVSEPAMCTPCGLSPYFVAAGYLLSMVIQGLGYFILGTGTSGMAISELVVICQHFLAIGCAGMAVRRGKGTAALFWLLFAVIDIVLVIPAVIQLCGTLLGHSLISDATWRALYTLYGAPVLMMLILPDRDQPGRARLELFLDFLQLFVAVGLAFSTLFYLPLQQMLPADAFEHNLGVSNLESLFLLTAVFIRGKFARLPAARDRIRRLGLFLLTCGLVTFIGNWIDQHHYVAVDAWWDLGWDIPIVMAGMVAITWQPSPEPDVTPDAPRLFGLVAKSIGLVAVLSFVHLMIDRWKEAHGQLLTTCAIGIFLFAFSLRLALTQYHQQLEITRRKSAQDQLLSANEQIRVLLGEARRQNREITQINELGSLLQACSSPGEAYQLVPERLQNLFPGSSGSLALLNPSQNRVESVAEWGPTPPADQIFAPNECWALRRGCVHILPGGPSVLRCGHLNPEAPSVCIPLVANGTAIGTLAIQDERAAAAAANSGDEMQHHAFAHRRGLVVAVGEHIALALANLGLRETLRMQAVRDPLTGLYNRRYMQEFLEREAHRARRKNRSLSVMALDLDKFKLFNDTYGHAAGDHALRLVGEVLLRSVRADDFACRSGGEEFVMILPECSLQQALSRAEQIRVRLRDCPVEYGGAAQKRITVSIGVATLDETTDRLDRLLACADEALYEAKKQGRDRVVASRSLTGQQAIQAHSATAVWE